MVSPHHVLKITTALSAVALAASVAVAPAYALQDIAIEDAVAQRGAVTADNGVVVQSDDQSDDQTGDQQSQDSMPDNPNAKLPDTVSGEISDDATVVSEDLAVTPEGEVKNIETGETVTDATLVGTQDQQPDPLAKTNGESFIPVSAEDVKNAVADANVQLSKFESNEYGAHWGTYNNTKAFFDYQNNLFVQQAKGVIDVSEWQGDIDWAKAKADGVEGVIIRLGYGWGNNADKKAQRNISECKRLGIPFGIYWYSYADTPSIAKGEGADVVAKLKQFGVNPSDLAYPVYYDLEKWTWKGHQPPTDPNVYNDIVNNWYSALQSAGYKNLSVYSYTSYLQGPLKHADIYAKTTWVAQYGARMGFDSFPTNSRGWQYTSSGKVDGISGNVDMNAFGNKEYVPDYPEGTGYYVSNSLKGGAADFSFGYGRAGDEAYAGDWNGDGKDSLTLRRGNMFYTKYSLTGGNADCAFSYGKSEDLVLPGDWDVDGKDTFAVRRGSTYYIKNSLEGGIADKSFIYGRSEDQTYVGDWNGDGHDTFVVRRGNVFYFKNSLTGGNADTVITYGRDDDQVYVGDWDGDGKDSLAVRRGSTFYVKNTIASGVADEAFSYGKTSDTVLVGDWDGDGKDTFMVRR
ncbi:GH25 family lysozyme [Bifidobacterium catenulatum]|uniref:GH25 family lysozyme n=1 Tax=Bifidobacterium catenulatum TaxID=1686 RepID=UPI0023ED5FD3|nr:GH25 family lysozyme [Bifidobacterium catenulatum]MDF4085970.1 GH25 family lysozyme [Bifidobacterium catenulatum]MDF4092686.1 GH25 family lysozyme [Bifidobacterium catenulatum]